MKSAPASMASAMPITASPADSPRRRAFSVPTWSSMVATTESTRSTSRVRIRPAVAVMLGSSLPTTTEGREWRRVFTRQVPFSCRGR